MQRRLRFRDLHLRGSKLSRARLLLEPSGKERLPTSILAANRLERSAAGGHALQVFGDRALKSLQADRETRETLLRDSSPAEGIQDLFSTTGADGGCHTSIEHGKLFLQECDIEHNRSARCIHAHYVISVHVENASQVRNQSVEP
jgi:hypothetical protein